MRTPHGAHCTPDILSRFYQRHQKLKQLRVLSPGRRRSRVTPLHARACRHAFYSLFQQRITHACASRCANNTEPPFCACDSPLTASHYRRGNGKRFSNPCPRPQRGTLNTHLPGLIPGPLDSKPGQNSDLLSAYSQWIGCANNVGFRADYTDKI